MYTRPQDTAHGNDEADVGANAPKELATATLESVVAVVGVTNVLGEMSPMSLDRTLVCISQNAERRRRL